jgi:hypothetical protein
MSPPIPFNRSVQYKYYVPQGSTWVGTIKNYWRGAEDGYEIGPNRLYIEPRTGIYVDTRPVLFKGEDRQNINQKEVLNAIFHSIKGEV